MKMYIIWYQKKLLRYDGKRRNELVASDKIIYSFSGYVKNSISLNNTFMLSDNYIHTFEGSYQNINTKKAKEFIFAFLLWFLSKSGCFKILLFGRHFNNVAL